MIEINHSLLSPEALDNLILSIITRQSTDYGEHEITIHNKKNQLLQKLKNKEAIIVYFSEEGFCDIVNAFDQELLKQVIKVKNDNNEF